jgi:hypothetical protein
MTKVKLVLVVGNSGSRVDFVAGWLSTLPEFIDNQWHIDMTTGQSLGNMDITKCIDKQDISIDTVFRNCSMELSPDADFYYAGSCHGRRTYNYQQQVQDKLITPVTIDTRSCDQSFLSWEFIVKTYLTKRRSSWTIGNKDIWLIDQSINQSIITDQDRIVRLKELIKQRQQHNLLNLKNTNMESVVEYSQLFQAGGSRYLCNVINLDVDTPYHQYWNSMLPFAESPKSINRWGYDWNYHDYF